jgi:hypothetical protein
MACADGGHDMVFDHNDTQTGETVLKCANPGCNHEERYRK